MQGRSLPVDLYLLAWQLRSTTKVARLLLDSHINGLGESLSYLYIATEGVLMHAYQSCVHLCRLLTLA